MNCFNLFIELIVYTRSMYVVHVYHMDNKLYQFIRVMPRISPAITDPYLYLAHLVRSLKNACMKEFTLL